MAITEAAPNQFPFLVDVFVDEGKGKGSGILISPEWVLTSAQLLIGCSSFRLLFGAHESYYWGSEEGDPPPQRSSVSSEQVFLHPGWNGATSANNLALIRAASPPELNAGVQPLAVLSATGHEVGQAVMGVGRATSLASGKVTTTVQVVEGTVIEASAAKKYFRDDASMASQVVVDVHRAAVLTPALISRGAGGPALVGLFNYGAISDEGPVVYSRLVDYADWIHANSGILMG